MEQVVAQPNRMVEFVREKVVEMANEPQRVWKELRTLMLVGKASIQDVSVTRDGGVLPCRI